MRPLTGELLLEAWQRGTSEPYHARALGMLAAACPDRNWDELADLSIAERNRELLRVRHMTFGDDLKGCLPCESCSTRVEFEIPVSSMMENPHFEGKAELMRPATSRDLVAVWESADPRGSLLAQCLLNGDDNLDPDRAAEEFNRLNADAEIQFTLACPACGIVQRTELDIVRFLWSELRHAAKSLLFEVHELASAYGWSEASILSMNASRRAMYLEMARV